MEIIETLVDKAKIARRESKRIEFKGQFDPKSDRDWCEIIKDIVAVANSGGGIILFGVCNDGSCSGFNGSALLSLDSAKIVDKIGKYTDVQFSDIEVIEIDRSGTKAAAFEIRGSRTPMIFTKEGSYVDHTG